MNNYILRIILLILLNCITSQASAVNYVDTYIQSIHLIQNDPDHLALILVVQNDCEKSATSLAILEEYQKEVDDMVNLIVVNCSTLPESDIKHVPACQSGSQIPMATFLIPPTEDVDITKPTQPKEQKMSAFSLKALQQGFQEYSPQFWKTLNNQDEYDAFLSDKQLNKVIITIHPIPLWWYGITQKFRDRLDFAVTTSEFSDKEFTILKLVNNKFAFQEYKGAKRYESLRAYVSKFANKTRVSRIKSQLNNPVQNSVVMVQSLEDVDFNNNNWVIVHYQSDYGSHPKLKMLQTDLKGFFTIYQIYRHYTKEPSLHIYPFNQSKHYIDIHNQNTEQVCSQLLEEITNKMNTDSLDLLNRIQQLVSSKKGIAVWFFDKKQVNKCQKLIAITISQLPQFAQLLDFYYISDPQEALKKQFTITKFPFISTLRLEQGQISQSDFDNYLSYSNIYEFMKQVSLKISIAKTVDLNRPLNQQEFDFYCKVPNKICVIVINENRNKLDEDAAIKASIQVNNERYVWVLLHRHCQQLLIDKYKFTVPGVVLYDAENYQYSMMQSVYNLRNIETFMKKKKKEWIELDYQLEIQKCSKVNDDL